MLDNIIIIIIIRRRRRRRRRRMILNSLTALTAWTADPTYLHILYSSLVIIILIIIIRPSDSDS